MIFSLLLCSTSKINKKNKKIYSNYVVIEVVLFQYRVIPNETKQNKIRKKYLGCYCIHIQNKA